MSAVAAAAVIIAAAITAMSAIWVAIRSDRRDREERHKERLRSIYSEVMLAAVRLVPDELNARLGSGAGPTTSDQIDVLTSRLSLERWQEGDRIRDELKEVWRAAQEWRDHRDAPERNHTLSDPLRANVVESLDRLEDAMRANLGTSLPSPGSDFSSLSRH